jgi:phage protein D
MPRAEVPDVSVRINGAALPPAAQTDLQSLTVQEDLQALSMFTLVLYNWDDDRLQVSWSDSPLFAVGNEVEIWLGYVDDLHKVMAAEITSLEPAFTAEQPPLLTVRGYDHRHRLARGRKTRTFSQMKDSDIATQVAREAGLEARVTNTNVKLPYVIQSNQTDWEFLQRRAGRIGYELFVRERVLYFRPPQFTAKPAVTLSLGQDITEFTPRLNSLRQVAEVSVRGWDVKQKREIVCSTAAGPGGMGGRSPGPTATRRAFGRASLPDVDLPVRSSGEGDSIARGRFDAMALAYVEGEVVAHGRPQLRTGMVVDVNGAGRTFSGPYYVTAITHTMTPEHGYHTTLTVQRNAA